jgi:hypothetical protein
LVLAAQKDFDLERNKKSFAVSKKDCKQVSSHIKGIGKINTMDDVAMTCANICGVQLAIVDIVALKPILYQIAWKIIKFIENKKPKPGCAIIECNCASSNGFHGDDPSRLPATCFILPRIPSTQTRLNWEMPTRKPSRLQARSSSRQSSSQNCLITLKKILSPITFLCLQRVFSSNFPWLVLSTNLAPMTPPNKVPTRSAPLPPKVEGTKSQVQRNPRRNFLKGA